MDANSNPITTERNWGPYLASLGPERCRGRNLVVVARLSLGTKVGDCWEKVSEETKDNGLRGKRKVIRHDVEQRSVINKKERGRERETNRKGEALGGEEGMGEPGSGWHPVPGWCDVIFTNGKNQQLRLTWKGRKERISRWLCTVSCIK